MEVDDNENEVLANLVDFQQRKMRLRDLLSEAEDMAAGGHVGVQTVHRLEQILDEANAINCEIPIKDRVENVDETLLDFQVVSSVSDILGKCIESLDVAASTYDVNEFVEKVKLFVRENASEEEEEETEDGNLELLLPEARKVIRRLPDYYFLYGAYDLNTLPQPKVRKERSQVVAREKFTKKVPEKVTELDKEEEGIEETVRMMYAVLQEEYVQNSGNPIGYYHYVIDTDSYGRTIENMFYFSFLIRDGKAHLELDSRGSPIIKPIGDTELKRYRENEGKNIQTISSISMDDWEKFTKPGMLQQRKAS